MAAMPKTMKEVMGSYAMVIELRGVRWWCVKAKVAKVLFLVAAWLLGVALVFKDVEVKDDGL